jgi:hypothetical protein
MILQWVGHVHRLPDNHIPKDAMKDEFAGSQPVGYPGFKLEEGVKECAARLLWCDNWKLTSQNNTVWRQKLWEAKG